MAMNLIKYKATRKVVRSNATKIISKIDALLNDDTTSAKSLEDELIKLNLKETALKDLDNKVLENMTTTSEDDPAIETEVNTAEEYQEQIAVIKNEVNRKLKILSGTLTPTSGTSTPASGASVTSAIQQQEQIWNYREESKLPTLTLPKFRGDITEWPGFWGQFCSTVNSRIRLSKVERFNYLLNYLDGEAKEALSGLKISDENYDVAVKLLEQRYDRKDLAIHTLMNNLLRLEAVEKSSDVKKLRQLYDACERNLRSMKSLGVDTQANGVSLCPVLTGLLPDDIRLKYSMIRDKKEWDVNFLVSFLKDEVEGRETSFMLRKDQDNVKHAPKLEKPTTSKYEGNSQERYSRKPNWPSATALNTNVKQHHTQYQKNIYCIFCKSSAHSTNDCQNYTLEEKKRTIQTSGRCFICTRIGHDARRCTSKFRQCRICDERHNTAICEKNKAHKVTDRTRTEEASTKKSEAITTSLVRCTQSRKVLLQTAMAIAKSPNETRNNKKIRFILDNCSQATFILEDVARSLTLPVVGERILEINNFGNQNPEITKRKLVRLTIQNTREGGEAIELLAIEMPYLTTVITLIDCEEVERFAKERNLTLADEPSKNTPQSSSIGILIGADYYYDVATLNHERINGALVAVETKLGWTIQGPTNSGRATVNSVGVQVMNVNVRLTESVLAKSIKAFWEIESIGIMDSPEETTSEQVMEKFRKETIFENGRYGVKFPWRASKEDLPNNVSVTTNRMRGLLLKFKRDPTFYQDYKAVIEEQLNLGIAERVPDEESTPPSYYMPHQGVKKNERLTTKLRVVFDASSKVKGAPSLNECLDSGPNLNPDILKLLIRFRTHLIAMTADIEKAFLQVSLIEKERNFVRFLWVKEQNGRLLENQFETLRMTRVPFGVTSRPFLLAATIKLHLENYTNKEKETVDSLGKDIYVDDYTGGKKNVTEAYEFYKRATCIMKDANMNLRKWRTNSPELRKKWGEENSSTESLTLEGEESRAQKILGLLWEPNADVFTFDLSNLVDAIQEAEASKRGVLSAVAQIYDPLGMLTPFVIRAKFLFQQLWVNGVKWDQELPSEIKNLFENWKKEMPIIRHVKLQRCYYMEEEEIIEEEIQAFCDASSQAYATVIYLRYVTITGKVGVIFVASKARVAPLKSLSIPRLELMGCLLGARLINVVEESFESKNIARYLWTDSMVALGWIKSNSKALKPFVQNRIQEIHTRTDPQEWQHCPGFDNSADISTRGAKAEDLVKNDDWWTGPQWLRKEKTSWPSNLLKMTDELKEIMEIETKNILVVQCQQGLHQGISTLIDLSKYQSISKVYRISARVHRFVKKLKKVKIENGPITAEEIGLMEIEWIKSVQREDFKHEISTLQNGGKILKSDIAKLNPILNRDGLLCVGGRLDQSRMTEEEKHPIILNKGHRLALLLINRSHWQVCHAGVQSTLTQTRGRFWIITGRKMTQKVIHNCMVCRRFQAQPGAVQMAPLPQERIDESPPFEAVGIDFAGPLYVKVGKNIEKAYICLFTCAVIRAIHLELVPFLNTYEFLLALRRMIARRGIPHIIHSDNAKTFIRANEDMKEIWGKINGDEAKSFYGEKGISWRFIADRAAW